MADSVEGAREAFARQERGAVCLLAQSTGPPDAVRVFDDVIGTACALQLVRVLRSGDARR